MLIMRRQFFSARSACAKKTKWLISAVVFKNNFFSLVLKSPTHAGFIGVKEMGQKSHNWEPLNLLYFKSFLDGCIENFWLKKTDPKC